MKKAIAWSMAACIIAGSYSPALAADKNSKYYATEILAMQPQLTEDSLFEDAKSLAKEQKVKTADILEKMYLELSNDAKKAAEESSGFQALGNEGGSIIIGSSTKGHIYYTPSATAYLDHGHVGMYYTSSTIVESVPGDGVRTISASSRKVDSKAVIKSVKTTTANRDAAANWARSEVGESYSYNFATNRSTSHYGAKNCSKLLWSAYKLKSGLDLDVDGGLGVYPRDVRDSKDTTLVKTF
ncbi:hypothetical protein GJU40_06720 [Bacillus lacus]|uniref:YycO n=1 Tax=Metabacillus lacus TaxID=1983721 RepID=A0A7X2IXZ3_9BACI|nr:YiiX/YebB-like N1pC/P60 family cysteine hydrolase [Metabacillus lacus]MRX71865.1 hypothetical protein [Metabacillus lacus]